MGGNGMRISVLTAAALAMCAQPPTEIPAEAITNDPEYFPPKPGNRPGETNRQYAARVKSEASQ